MKPQQLYKKPCTRCGCCCREEICMLGETFLSTRKAPCPALKKVKGVYSCGLITYTHLFVFPNKGFTKEHYHSFKESLVKQFSFGVGCDAGFTTKEVEE